MRSASLSAGLALLACLVLAGCGDENFDLCDGCAEPTVTPTLTTTPTPTITPAAPSPTPRLP